VLNLNEQAICLLLLLRYVSAMRLQYPFTYCEIQKQANISLIVKILETAYSKKEEDGAWFVIEVCFKLLVVLSLHKPTFLFLAQTFLVNIAIEIFIDLVG